VFAARVMIFELHSRYKRS